MTMDVEIGTRPVEPDEIEFIADLDVLSESDVCHAVPVTTTRSDLTVHRAQAYPRVGARCVHVACYAAGHAFPVGLVEPGGTYPVCSYPWTGTAQGTIRSAV